MNIKRIVAYAVYYVVSVLSVFMLQVFAFGYFEKSYQTLFVLSCVLFFVIIPIEKYTTHKIDTYFPRK
jgi:hypothetical protein